jgi:hypothetical protein
MATPEQFKDINLFIVGGIHKIRTFQAGPQYADDPGRLRGIMQAVKVQFPTADLSDDQVRLLYESFQEEAKIYRQRYHQYFAPTGAYDGVLGDIKAMLDRLKKKERGT